MTVPAEITRSLRNATTRAGLERRRAERVAEIAERHEQQMLVDPPLLLELHLRLAAMHRQAERQHLAAARMHAAHSVRLRSWIDSADRQHAVPRFMASVAEAAEADGAAVTLFGPGLVETFTAVSDNTAKAAQDAEFTLGEGPGREVMLRRCAVRASGAKLSGRWPNYGPAIAELGIRSVAAAPLDLTGTPLGALTLFGPRRPRTAPASDLRPIADAVATMLLTDDPSRIGDEATSHPLLTEASHRAVIHQATGMLSVECGRSMPDALALIRARAFAEGRPIEQVASDVVNRTLKLT